MSDVRDAQEEDTHHGRSEDRIVLKPVAVRAHGPVHLVVQVLVHLALDALEFLAGPVGGDCQSIVSIYLISFHLILSHIISYLDQLAGSSWKTG